MGNVTRLLSQIDEGDEHAVEQLVELVHDELRKLASAKVNQEKSDTLQVTELVNEAYLRLVREEGPRLPFRNRSHFFGAAAEAMRRILVERARKRSTWKRGAGEKPVQLDETFIAIEHRSDEIVAIHEALEALEEHDDQSAELVKLRYFVGMGHKEAAEVMGISKRAADRIWVIARTWLFKRLESDWSQPES